MLGLAPGRLGPRRGLSGGRGRLGRDLRLSARARTADRDLFRGLGDGAVAGGAAVPALVFLSDLEHPQWAGDLTLEAQARLIAGAAGLSGRNVDYLRDLVLHLHEEGVADRTMERLLARVEALEADAEAA